jgi:metallopeptidase family M12-like protein
VRYVALGLIVALALAAGTIAPDLAEHWLTRRITIHLNDKERVTVRFTSVATHKGGTTWRGETEGTGEPALLMGWKGGRFSGMFAYRGRVYAFDKLTSMDGRIRAVAELDPERMQAQHDAMHAPASPQREASIFARGVMSFIRRARAAEDHQHLHPAATPREIATIAAPEIQPMSRAQRQQLAARKTTIDVMVLYTSKVASKYVDVETDLIAHAIEEANASFRNSGIGNIALRLAHSEQTDYTETDNDHFNHLYRMVDGVGAFDNVRALRNQWQADVVVLIVDDASGCGLATRVAADAEEAFAVVHHACAALVYSIPHEIGHIIGARHDVALDETMSPAPYGHGYVSGTKWRDIMSYNASCNGCPRLPIWSNPTITVKGEPAGTLLADNARVLLEQAERVANFR